MADPPTTPAPSTEVSPPRAFTQGVGTVFQLVGGLLFIAMMGLCCISGPGGTLRPDLIHVGWHLPGDVPGEPSYSIPVATTAWVFGGIFLGLATAAMGLGMQAEHRRAAWGGMLISVLAVAFWGVQSVFIIQHRVSVAMAIVSVVMFLAFGVLLVLAIGAVLEMRRNPPPPGHEVLPPDYRVPYSHMHQDPPEVRLERELAQRRERLAVQQKELEAMEQRLQRRLKEKDDQT